MAKYLNTSMSIQEFYGIEIKPQQVKAFPGYVNHSYMIRVSDETPETTDEKQSTETVVADAKKLTETVADKSTEKADKSTEKADKSSETSSAKSATKSKTTQNNK